MHGGACKQCIFRSITHLLSVLCVWMKTLSHAGAKIKKKGSRVSTFALLLDVFKWHHGSEGVKGSKLRLVAKAARRRGHVSPLLRTLSMHVSTKLSHIVTPFSLKQPSFIGLSHFSSSYVLSITTAPRPLSKTPRIPHSKTQTFGHCSLSYAAPSVQDSLPSDTVYSHFVSYCINTAPKTHLFKTYCRMRQ